ncbi:MAG: precorrin-3B C(17)-methyltransferase [Desulfovibrio sp.]|nr:precorrin-3B C(17)-methyltransferase [Desulfovibrio sp.]
MSTLTFVGIGPGDPNLIPPLAQTAIENAHAIYGYAPYLALLPKTWCIGKSLYPSGMRQEEERVLAALHSAHSGIPTVLVCSGDPGVYALAGLGYTISAQHKIDVPIQVIPGIPALCAAAALVGAPLVHDFASVSLSDLLTPWERIAKRLDYASKADFVLVLYNPRSHGRPHLLEKALALLAHNLGPHCPVALVTNAYRAKQHIAIHTLETLPCEEVSMLSILIVGNSQTTVVGHALVTPRGYRCERTAHTP